MYNSLGNNKNISSAPPWANAPPPSRPQDSDLMPFWYVNDGQFKIERLVPMQEFSRDELRFERVEETLALYRLTFGQPRKEELVEAFRNAGLTNDEVQLIRSSLLINLSPLNQINQ